MKHFLFAATLSLLACSPSTDSEKPTARPNEAACTTNKDCGQDSVCLAVANTRSCAPKCTASADSCGATSSCGGVGVLEVDVCKPKPANDNDEPTNNNDEETTAPSPEEEPTIPCASDAECQSLQEGTVCVQYSGGSTCTKPCTSEDDCALPASPLFTVDFMACLPDEANKARKACVPDPRCFSSPTACVTFTIPGEGMDAGFPFP